MILILISSNAAFHIFHFSVRKRQQTFIYKFSINSSPAKQPNQIKSISFSYILSNLNQKLSKNDNKNKRKYYRNSKNNKRRTERTWKMERDSGRLVGLGVMQVGHLGKSEQLAGLMADSFTTPSRVQLPRYVTTIKTRRINGAVLAEIR